jgi:hypothetical protein
MKRTRNCPNPPIDKWLKVEGSSVKRIRFRKGGNVDVVIVSGRGRRSSNPSDAYEAGRRALRAAAAKHGTVNLTPSIAQRDEWGHAWNDFMRGWNAERGFKSKYGRKPKNNPISAHKEKLYRKALAIDERFQKALERKYGSRAGDMRYRTKELPPYLRRLGTAMQKAAERYQAAS